MLKFAIKRKTLELYQEAVDNKDYLRTKLLIENCDKQKFVVDSLDANGLTPLQRSCFLGNVRLVRLLIEAGAKVSIKDSEGWTVLHASAVAGNYSVVKYLIKIGVDLEAKTDRGELALDLAVNDNVVLLLVKGMIRKGMYTMVRQYFKRNPNTFQRIINDLKKRDKLPTATARRLLPQRPRSLELPNLPTDIEEPVPSPKSAPADGEPVRGAFRRSLRGRKFAPVQRRPSIDELSEDEVEENNPVPLSSSRIYSSLTSLSSISSSSSVPSSVTEWPDVIYASHKSTRTSSSSLSPTSAEKRVKFVGVHSLCSISKATVAQVKKWIASGKIEVNTLNDTGVAPLHEASYADNVPVMELLIRRGADVNIQSSDGSTPLHAAVHGGSRRAIALLIDCGADLFLENDNGALPIEETEEEAMMSMMQQAMTLM